MNNIAKSSGIVLLLSLIAIVIGYSLRLFLARNLSVEDYGLFYAVLSSIGLLAVFRDPGLGVALAKFLPEFIVKNQAGKIKASLLFVALAQLTIGIVIVLPVFFFADTIAVSYFGTQNATLPIQIISLSFLISILMSVLQATFQGFGKMFYFSMVEPLRLSLVFITTFLLIGMGTAGVVGAAYGYLVAPIVVSSILFLAFLRTFPLFKVKTELSWPLVKSLGGFGVPVFVASMGSIMFNYIGTVILTIYRSLYEVGLYHAALPTSQLLWFFVGSVGSVLLPTVSGLWSAGKKDAISNGLLILSKILFMAITPIVTVFVAFPEIILRIFGESFVAASASLQILAVGAIFYTFYFMFNVVLIAIGKPKIHMGISLVVGILSVILSLILIPPLGIIGAAASVVSSYVFGMILSIIYVRKFIDIKLPLFGMAKTVLGGSVVLFLIYSLKTAINADPLVEIIIAGTVSMAAYTIFAIRFIMDKSDLKTLSAIGIKLPGAVHDVLMKVLR